MFRNLSVYSRAKIALTAGLAVALLAFGGYLYWALHRPLSVATEVYVVKPGTGLRGLAHDLYRRGVISEPYTLTWFGYLTGRSRRLKAGEYRFPAGISAAELLDQVVAGRVIEYPLVLVEGWNFRQIMEAIKTAPKLTSTLEGLTPQEIMARLGHPDLNPEGRFFPDTYFYSQGHTDVQILSSAYNKMHTVLEQEWNSRIPGLPLETMDQALTLASIIEKETARPEERRLIAGVFINRLRKGMRLQSDPTVIYGLGDRFDGNLHLRDLHTDTAYNTYTRGGLPPTPIAMPGRASLVAATHPAGTNALYFVARGDGTHEFSATLEEQSAAVLKYQLGGKVRDAASKSRPESGAAGGSSQN